jgi:hypothetical protein
VFTAATVDAGVRKIAVTVQASVWNKSSPAFVAFRVDGLYNPKRECGAGGSRDVGIGLLELEVAYNSHEELDRSSLRQGERPFVPPEVQLTKNPPLHSKQK